MKTVHKDELQKYDSEQDMIKDCTLVTGLSESPVPSGSESKTMTEDEGSDNYYDIKSIQSLKIVEEETPSDLEWNFNFIVQLKLGNKIMNMKDHDALQLATLPSRK